MQMMLCFSLNAYTSLFIVFEIQRDYNDKGFVCQKFYLLSVLMAVIQRHTVFPERTLWKGEEGRLPHISGGLMCNLKGQCTLLSMICPVLIGLFLITSSNWDCRSHQPATFIPLRISQGCSHDCSQQWNAWKINSAPGPCLTLQHLNKLKQSVCGVWLVFQLLSPHFNFVFQV